MKPKNPHPFGTQRRDIYMRATKDLPYGTAVRRLTRHNVTPHSGQGSAVFGVTVEDGVKGGGVWVRIYGPAAVRVSEGKR